MSWESHPESSSSKRAVEVRASVMEPLLRNTYLWVCIIGSLTDWPGQPRVPPRHAAVSPPPVCSYSALRQIYIYIYNLCSVCYQKEHQLLVPVRH